MADIVDYNNSDNPIKANIIPINPNIQRIILLQISVKIKINNFSACLLPYPVKPKRSNIIDPSIHYEKINKIKYFIHFKPLSFLLL